MKKNIIIIVSLFISIASFSQQTNVSYFMDRLPQSNLLNPAREYPCKVWVNSYGVPIFGQLPPTSYFNFGNSFSVSDVLRPGVNTTSDSLGIDIDNLLSKLRPVNFLTMDARFEVLSVGFHVNDWLFNVGVTEIFDMRVTYPKTLIEFPYKGNAAYMDENIPMSLKDLGIDFTHYREYAVGASKDITDKLRLGGKMKFLFGKSNVNTKTSDISIYTYPDDYYWRVKSKMNIRASIPSQFVEIDYDNSYGVADSLEVDVVSADSTTTEDIKNYLMNGKNMGLAIDFGAIYKLTDKITVSASIIDLGFIRWKSDVYNFVNDGEFLFEGYDVSPHLNSEDSTDHAKVFADSLYQEFQVDETKEAYGTFMPTKIYLAGRYKLNDKLEFGAMSRTEFFKKHLSQQFTLSANANLTKWFTGVVSWSVINRSPANMGVGLILRGGFMQFFLMSDNVLGFYKEESTGAPLPYSTRNINVRFGWNLVFGCKQKEKGESLL